MNNFSLEYVYDASGAKLARKVTNTSVSPNTVKWEYYVNDIVFDDHTPLYFVNETGRLRVSKEADFAFSPAPSLSLSGNSGLMIDGKKAFYDFYLTDHLDNTRMVLTEEEHNEYHKATMEVTDARQQGYEERMFGNVDVNGNPASNNEVIATRNDMPIIWTSHYSNSNKKASKLDPTHPVGPNVFLKVMAGDNLDLSTDYFYNQSASGNSNIANTIISSLVNALVGNGAATAANKNLSSQINSQLNGMPDYTNILNNPTGTGIPPNAHINWLFFDENFNPVSQGALRVTSNNDYHLTETDIQVPANGYVYIYLSNSSNNAVYFDEFWVRHKRGRILQEHHYYPYGLQIASISSKAAGEIDNMYRYQGAYSDWEEETGLSDFELRSYDAQVGRWTGVDPYDEFASGYVGMGNDPVSYVDEDGGSSGIAGALIGAIGGGIAMNSFANSKNIGGWGKIGMILGGALAGAGLGYGIGETLFPQIGYEASFTNNIASFYKGLFGGTPGDIVKLNNGVCGSNAVGAIVPDLWSWAGNIKLPSFDFLKNGKDVFKIGEKIVLNAIFVANQATIDFTQTDKKQLDQTIDKIIRTLRKNKNASLPLSGGTNNPETVNNPTKPPPQEIQDLLKNRVKTIRDYIQQKARPKKITRRVYDNGKIIRGNKLVTGTLTN